MKLILTILNFLGLTTLKNQAAELKKVIDSNATTITELTEKELAYKKLFDWELKEKDLIDFKTYCLNNNIDQLKLDNGKWKEVFDLYYATCRMHEYQAYKIMTLCKEPDLLNAFLLEFSSFNWVEVEQYMKSVNWYWKDNKRTPTIDELKDCVITLLNTDYVSDGACMSGGFHLYLYYKDKLPICKILFEKEDGYLI
jgi:hypothetical protein